MDSKQQKEKIIGSVKETLESSSIHAIPNITRNKFFSIKAMWFMFFLISSGWCIWFIIQSIMDFLNYDVVSKTIVNFETEMIFPVINICNLNTFKTQKINNVIKDYFQTNFPNMSLKYQSRVIAKTNIVKKFWPLGPFFRCTFLEFSSILGARTLYRREVNRLSVRALTIATYKHS